MRNFRITVAASIFTLLCACGEDNTPNEVISTDPEAISGPSFDLLLSPAGDVEFTSSCNAEAAPLVERGVALLHNMLYEQSRFVFRMAKAADKDCAMPYWGEAITMMHPLWADIPTTDELTLAQSIVAKAYLLDDITPRENAYLKTVEAYFEENELIETERLKKFEAAWKKVYDDYPDDLDARAFYSLSIISNAGTDEAIRRKAGALAKSIIDDIPNHPGAHHYTIHAYDTPSLAELALAVTDNYGNMAPRVPHASHMITHIATRLGKWDQSIEWNRISADASYEICVAGGEVIKEYVHALDYLAYAWAQKGQFDKVIEILEETDELQAPYDDLSRAGSAYALSALPARYVLERRDWKAAAELQPRMPADFPWEKEHDQFVAITHFARAVALSHLDRPEEAQADIDILEAMISDIADYSAYWSKQVTIQMMSAQAIQTYAKGDVATAISQMKEAAALEATTDKNAVTPGEVMPTAEMLGDMLRTEGDYEGALTAYRVSLVRSPGRYNSLYGAGKSAAELGNQDAAVEYFSELVRNAGKAIKIPTPLEEARDYLAAI